MEYQLSKKDRQWNAMWDLWVRGAVPQAYDALMRYYSEVNNGGHCQYFTNTEMICDIQEEMDAIASILPEYLKENLYRAYGAYRSLEDGVYDRGSEDRRKVLAIDSQCDDVFYENDEVFDQILEAFASTIEL